MYDTALEILHTGLPAPLMSSDVDLQKQALQGMIYARLHRFREAEQTLDLAGKNCAKANDNVISEVLTAEGYLKLERGEYKEAQSLFARSFLYAGQHNDRFLEAMALVNLSYCALRRERFDEAIDALSEANKVAQVVDARTLIATAQGNLGWVYYKIGEPDKSLELSLDAYKRSVQLGSVYDQVAWLTTIGLVYVDANKFKTAEEYYYKALDLSRRIGSKRHVFEAVTALAFVDLQTDQINSATTYADEAIGLAHAAGNRKDELYPFLAKGQIAARQHDPKQAEAIFLEVANDPKVDASLQWEAQHELANLYEEEHRAADAEKTYVAALAELEAARDSLHREESKLPFLTNGTRLYDDYVHFLVSQGKTAQALQVADHSRAQTLAEGLGLLKKTNPSGKSAAFRPAAFNPQQVASSFSGTALFYWLGSRESYLWAITPKQTALFHLPPATDIDAAVQNYRRAVVKGRDVLQTDSADGNKLYEMLVAPAQKLIAPNSRVLIVADGSLNNLNFETLPVSSPQPHYWIEDVSVVNASSLRLAANSRPRAEQSRAKVLLIGDPVSPNPDYPALPKASQEIEDIQKHFADGSRQVFARDQATAPTYVSAHPEQYAYIHFVAHGTASHLSPLDSAIVLSKSTAQEDSFKLYAREIIQHPLRADLVTISACYGSGARAYTGEGLVGLSWAFLRAGAHNVIGALWEVNDASTPQLMDQMYSELRKGRTPDAALRAAKLSLLHSEGVSRKPFYWAPFQLYLGS